MVKTARRLAGRLPAPVAGGVAGFELLDAGEGELRTGDQALEKRTARGRGCLGYVWGDTIKNPKKGENRINFELPELSGEILERLLLERRSMCITASHIELLYCCIIWIRLKKSESNFWATTGV